MADEQELIRRAQFGDRQSRLKSIMELARQRSGSALPALRDILAKDEPPVQIYAACALYLIAEDKRGVPILLSHLQGSNEDLREAAVYALGLMGKGILPELREASKRTPHSPYLQRIMRELSSAPSR